MVSASRPLGLAGVGVVEDVEAFGVGGHDAVLDAVVHHLDEVAGAVGSAVEIAMLGGAADLLASGRARGFVDAGGQRLEDRIESATTSSSPPIMRQ